MNNPFVTEVWMGSYWRQIEYENIKLLCFKCGKIGQVKENCILVVQEKKKHKIETGEGNQPLHAKYKKKAR